MTKCKAKEFLYKGKKLNLKDISKLSGIPFSTLSRYTSDSESLNNYIRTRKQKEANTYHNNLNKGIPQQTPEEKRNEEILKKIQAENKKMTAGLLIFGFISIALIVVTSIHQLNN